jgi:hypothetical protein
MVGHTVASISYAPKRRHFKIAVSNDAFGIGCR